MKLKSMTSATLLLVAIVTSTVAVTHSDTRSKDRASDLSNPATTKCEMTFTLKGWSAFYKTASGNGTITCENGQTADVKISAKGGGLTAGKSQVRDGHGTFSEVSDIKELLGTYAAASAAAGAVKSAEAHAMTKGPVSLALTGKGTGIELGVSFSKFTISRR